MIDRSGSRRTTVIALGVIAVAAAAGLAAVLLTWAPPPREHSRPLTPAETERLAAVRVTNHRDVRSGLRMTIGTTAARTDMVGWVDWSRPLAYLDIGGPGAGAARGLVQATPGLVLLRPDPAAVPVPAAPPLVPPADGWRVGSGSAARPLRPVLDLIFALAATRPEPAGAIPSGATRWLANAEVSGQLVDVLQAPLPGETGRRGAADAPGAPTDTTPRTATPGPARPTATRSAAPATSRRGWPGPTVSLPAAGGGGPLDGAARWWVDRDARLHRLEGRLPGGAPVTVELQRANRPVLWPVAALGGRAGLPRALTAAEEDRLARLAARTRAGGGATVTLTAPVGPGATLRGTGWISWTQRAAYLSVGDVPGGRTLRRYDTAGVWSTSAPGDALLPPPLPPPRTGHVWERGATGTDEVGELLSAALRVGVAGRAAGPSTRIRGDRLADRTVDVIEVGARHGRLRYWIDRAGLLRRLELRTRLGTYAQLDLVPGRVPALPAPVPDAREPRR
ncbi:hypothetical protein [Micromonospora sp. RTGN7]|uniref:hypothetical protein n=1 Tax=Micromonospora sp. RTGN7 TaxID=3016526 RepID=UPI0029FEEAAC|nr:hypothetical protein [Micromonospora sp. RTGN7]